MNLNLLNKIALVTASSGGIGLEIARSLMFEGATVIINARSSEKLYDAIESIDSSYPEAKILPLIADISTMEGCDNAIKSYPEIDILVNCLGIYESVDYETDEDRQRIFETNIMSGLSLSRYYLDRMLKRNSGRIVFISSEPAVNTAQEMVYYSATKTKQLEISRLLAEDTKNTKVTVNSVLSGLTRTETVMKFVKELFPELSQEDAERKFIHDNRPNSLLQRFIEPKEIGDIVTFICSERASVINGSNIIAKGGIT